MANYSQPPYGMPFPMPPPMPPHPQNPQGDPPGAPSNPRQAPNAEHLHNLWSWPGLNLQSYVQNMQQSSFPSWPPPPAHQQNEYAPAPFPPPYLTQSGFIPPPPPSANFYPPIPQPHGPDAPAPSFTAAFSAPSAQPPQQPMTLTSERFAEVRESEKEDGEVSEGSQITRSPALNGRAYAEPPRSVPQPQQSSHTSSAHEGRRQDFGGPHYPTLNSRPSLLQTKQKTADSEALDDMPQQREEAKQFVKLLNDNSIGYPSLASEGLDTRFLTELYRGLNLPLQPEPVPSPKAEGGTSSQPVPLTAETDSQSQQTRPAPAVKTNTSSATSVKSAPSPIDRKDYIARLQAARMAKQPAATKATPPQKTPPATAPTPAVTTNTPPPTTANTDNKVPSAKQPATEDEKARKTELIRQRLEAMRAKQTTSSPAVPQVSKTPVRTSAPSTVPLSSPSQNIEQTRSPNLQSAQLAQPMENVQNTQPVQISSFSKIPGLFMTASSAPASTDAAPTQRMRTPPNPFHSSAGAATRKRPVASDLDEVFTPQSSYPAFTRPLGQSPHEHDGESMIIDVSEDDSGGSEMDMVDDQTPLKPFAVSPPDPNRNGQQILRNFPPLSDFPSRSTSVRPASSAVSTPGPQTPGGFARKEELEKKEKDLAALKLSLQRKLAKQRERQKAAAAASSPVPQKMVTQTVLKQADPYTEEPPPVSETTQANLISQKNSPVIASSSAVDMSKESKKRRRAEIESGLPSLEAEIASNTARMAQMMKEMEKLREDNLKISQNKEMLIRELERLGIDTEGMPHAELQAKKDEIEHGMDIDSVMLDSSAAQSGAIISGSSNGFEHSPPSGDVQHPKGPEHVTEVDATTAPAPPSATQAPVAHLLTVEDNMTSDQELGRAPSPKLSSAGNSVLATAPTEVLVQPVESHGSATSVDDDEDFYSPEPTVSGAVDKEPESIEAAKPTAKSPSEEGEVEMSESSSSEDEGEYEPEEPQVVVLPVTLEPVNHNVDRANLPGPSPSSSRKASDDEGEIYEPPEPNVDHQMIDVQPDPTNVTSASNLQPIEDDAHGAMDISMSSSDESDSSDSVQQSEFVNNRSISFNNAPDSSIAAADNSTPVLQSQTMPTPQTSAIEMAPAAKDMVKPASFVPYESPLRMFKSYRYHPAFSQNVTGGFLSMTYSHQIDPEKPLCQFESVGGTCNDPNCLDQHFRGMNISGEKLLVQLGTANPGKTPEEKQLWNDGLRSVLKELRLKNIKDPNGIAMEIARYRRQFLNDDTRVVNL